MNQAIEHVRVNAHAALPQLAVLFNNRGYAPVNYIDLAACCSVSPDELRTVWSDKGSVFIATIEWCCDAVQRFWCSLFGAEVDEEESLEAIPEELTIGALLELACQQEDEPRILAAVGKINRTLSQTLAALMVGSHVAALDGSLVGTAQRTQAAGVLRRLAHLQRRLDDRLAGHRELLIAQLESEVNLAKRRSAARDIADHAE